MLGDVSLLIYRQQKARGAALVCGRLCTPEPERDGADGCGYADRSVRQVFCGAGRNPDFYVKILHLYGICSDPQAKECGQ